MGKVSDMAKAGAKKVLDRDKDGDIDVEDARAIATTWETRWPLGALMIVGVCSFVLGLWVRGLFA